MVGGGWWRRVVNGENGRLRHWWIDRDGGGPRTFLDFRGWDEQCAMPSHQELQPHNSDEACDSLREPERALCMEGDCSQDGEKGRRWRKHGGVVISSSPTSTHAASHVSYSLMIAVSL